MKHDADQFLQMLCGYAGDTVRSRLATECKAFAQYHTDTIGAWLVHFIVVMAFLFVLKHILSMTPRWMLTFFVVLLWRILF